MTDCRPCEEKKVKASATPKAQPPRYPKEASSSMIPASETPSYIKDMTMSVDDPCVVVRVSETLQSSAAHTGDAPPRVTQSNVGKYLLPAVQNTQATRPPLGERDLGLLTDKEKAWWVDDPGKDTPFLYSMLEHEPPKPPGDPLFTHRSKVPLFPRPRQYELGYAAAAREAAALNAGKKVECDCEAKKSCCTKPPKKSQAVCQVPPWWHQVPFWWWGQAGCRPLPVDDINTYAIIPEQNPNEESQDLMKMLLLDRSERYIPGEIYCDERRKIQGKGDRKYDKCHPAPPPMTTEQRSAQARQDEVDTCENRPWSKAVGAAGPAPPEHKAEKEKHNEIPCIICKEEVDKHDRLAAAAMAQCHRLRREELFKVGQPFKSAACRWNHQIYPPQHSTRIGPSPTRQFPHTRLSSI